jgi:hypothetical protein
MNHVLALKSNGTLWGWGENNNSQLGMAAKRRITAPIQIGKGSDWVAAYAHDVMSLAVKADGSVWRWGRWTIPVDYAWRSELLEQPERWEGAPASTPNWQGVSGMFGLAVTADGTLWGTGPFPAFVQRLNSAKRIVEVARLGHDSDWKLAANSGSWLQIAAIKRDGSLWRSAPARPADPSLTEREIDFTRWGKHSDWINVTSSDTLSMLVLSADGSLWQWGEDDNATRLLAPSRKLQKIANVFE